MEVTPSILSISFRTFQPDTDHGGWDAEDRSLRCQEWNHDPHKYETTYTTEYVYLMWLGMQTTHVKLDLHTCGLFARVEWIELLQCAGWEPQVIPDP